jgi:hypothetical protein
VCSVYEAMHPQIASLCCRCHIDKVLPCVQEFMLLSTDSLSESFIADVTLIKVSPQCV